MPWLNDRYYYTRGMLSFIAEVYPFIYEGLPLRNGEVITDGFTIAEYKSDFDRALTSIGRGQWEGNLNGYSFKDYRYFGKLQRIIIADIFNVDDSELYKLHFTDIPRLRGYAYSLMRKFLNGE